MERQQYYTQETTGIRYPIGDLYGYPDSLIRGRTGAAYLYGLDLIEGEPKSVLDYGSGRGHGVRVIQERFSPNTIVSADKHIPYLRAQKAVFVGGGENSDSFHFVGSQDILPFKNSTFDLVTLMHVIEHIKNPEDLIRDIHRVLTADGQLLVATPDINNLVGKNPHDEHVYNDEELGGLLRSSGFSTDIYYIIPNNRAQRVHNRKKWFGTHAPWTRHLRDRVNPRIWEAVMFRSGITREPLQIDDFKLSDSYDSSAIDLIAVASKI